MTLTKSILIAIFIFFLPQAFSSESSELFSKVRPSLFLVKIALDSSAPKSSYGSGFAVSRDGLIITNYHVISEKVQDEEGKYKIFVEDHNSNVVEAALIKFDVIHDLALIKIDKVFDQNLEIATTPLNKGENIYSFGVPKDLNEVIVEGTYNGSIEAGIYEQLHLSSAINSGMSGGPIVNASGKVVGVNVSILLDSQNISFGVPKNFVTELIKVGVKSLTGKKEKEESTDEVNKKIFAEIETQLVRVADSIESSLNDDLEFVTLDNFLIPQSKSLLKCWSYYKNSKELSYQINRSSCQLNGAVYIKDGEYTGSYNASFTVIGNKKRNKLQFYHLLESYYNEIDTSYFSDDDFISTPICRDLNIKNSGQIPFKVNYCLMKYKKFSDLYILDIKGVSLLNEDKNIIMELHLYGVKRNQINIFVSKYLDSIRIKNA